MPVGAVLLYHGEDQFSAVVTKENQYNLHAHRQDLCRIELLLSNQKKFDNYGMVDGAVTARYNAGQILIDGMKPGHERFLHGGLGDNQRRRVTTRQIS